MPDSQLDASNYNQSARGSGIAQAAGPVRKPRSRSFSCRRRRSRPGGRAPAGRASGGWHSCACHPASGFVGCLSAESTFLRAGSGTEGSGGGAQAMGWRRMPTVAVTAWVAWARASWRWSLRIATASTSVGGVYWVSFADPAPSLPRSRNACSGLPDLPVGFQELDPQTQLGMILGAWRNGLPRLLIFDNCEDESLLEQWRPTTGAARVLLTSRRGAFDPALGVKVLALQTLPRADSVALLQKFLASAQVVNRPSAAQAGCGARTACHPRRHCRGAGRPAACAPRGRQLLEPLRQRSHARERTLRNYAALTRWRIVRSSRRLAARPPDMTCRWRAPLP